MHSVPHTSILAVQVARVAGEGPIVTQQAYTTLVNRLTLLLRRAEGNSRITGMLKRRAKVRLVVDFTGCAGHTTAVEEEEKEEDGGAGVYA